MALILNLKCVENLQGKSDRQAKVSFRGKTNISSQLSILHFFGACEEKVLCRGREKWCGLHTEIKEIWKTCTNFEIWYVALIVTFWLLIQMKLTQIRNPYLFIFRTGPRDIRTTEQISCFWKDDIQTGAMFLFESVTGCFVFNRTKKGLTNLNEVTKFLLLSWACANQKCV